MITLKKEVKWRKYKNNILICNCKILDDLKIDLKYNDFMKKISEGLNEDALNDLDKKILNEFKIMKLTENIEIRRISKKDFDFAMQILDNELGEERVRTKEFLREKFREFPAYFIGAYLGKELIGVVCGFPREDYLLMSEIAVDCRFQKRHFGKKLVEAFEKEAFKKYKKINVGARDNAIGFYLSLKYKPFLLVQFEKGVYVEKNFPRDKIIAIRDYGIEIKSDDCSIDEINQLRKKYLKSNIQYIFTKETSPLS